MIVLDKKAPFINKSRKFYRKLCEYQNKAPSKSNVILFETEHLNDPLIDTPNEFSRIFKRFLSDTG